MDIRRMKYFVSVVRNKNITKAAEELHISQPSLSTQIKILEERVGCKLLDRNNREISLTEPGEILYKHACNLLKQFENVYKEMVDIKEVGYGKINIGMFPSASYWIPKIIQQLKKKYPKICINITEMGADSIEESLKNYDIHLGITSKFIHSDIFTLTPIYDEELKLITCNNHPFKELKQIDIADLSEEKFILYTSGYQLRDLILKSFHAAGLEPNVQYESGRFDTMLGLVSSELGVAFVPENSLKSANSKDINVINIKNPTPKRTLYIVLHKDRYYQPAIHELKKLIINFFNN